MYNGLDAYYVGKVEGHEVYFLKQPEEQGRSIFTNGEKNSDQSFSWGYGDAKQNNETRIFPVKSDPSHTIFIDGVKSLGAKDIDFTLTSKAVYACESKKEAVHLPTKPEFDKLLDCVQKELAEKKMDLYFENRINTLNSHLDNNDHWFWSSSVDPSGSGVGSASMANPALSTAASIATLVLLFAVSGDARRENLI